MCFRNKTVENYKLYICNWDLLHTWTFNSNKVMEAWISGAISSTSAWDSLVVRTVSDMRLTASAIEPAQCKRNSFRATAICAAVPCKRWGAGEAQHFADNVGSVDVPGCTSITPFSTDWLAVVIDVSAINACVGSFQCEGTCNDTYVINNEAYSKDQASDHFGGSVTFSVMDTCVCVVSLTRLLLFLSLFMFTQVGLKFLT